MSSRKPRLVKKTTVTEEYESADYLEELLRDAEPEAEEDAENDEVPAGDEPLPDEDDELEDEEQESRAV